MDWFFVAVFAALMAAGVWKQYGVNNIETLAAIALAFHCGFVDELCWNFN